MAPDTAPQVSPEPKSAAYFSPVADFVLLATLTVIVALTCAAIMIP